MQIENAKPLAAGVTNSQTDVAWNHTVVNARDLPGDPFSVAAIARMSDEEVSKALQKKSDTILDRVIERLKTWLD